MAIEEILLSLGKHVAKKTADAVWELVKKRDPSRQPLDQRIERGVAAQLTFVSNWSFSSQFRGQTEPQSTTTTTIPLRFTITPRRFRQVGTESAVITEPDILTGGRHTLILGLPGAGKTTALRRLCQVLLFGDSSIRETSFQFPIVVRLRDIRAAEHQNHPLLNHIAKSIGLITRIHAEKMERVHVIEPTEAEEAHGKKKEERIEVYYIYTELCEEEPLESFLVDVLNDLHPVLMLDGLDEVDPAQRNRVDADIRHLVEATRASLVLVTCRSGEPIERLGSILQLEVCDFREADVRLMAERWLGKKAADFLHAISPPPIRELASRPLLLAQMLNLFALGGHLPTQPVRLYKQLALLMIREWDMERQILRRSKYADFGADEKVSFLAEVAYELTFSAEAKLFSEDELVAIYLRICERYDLPSDQALLVAREIESHTGIVVESGYGGYEFTHLTFQEFLTAEHLLKLPFPFERLPFHLSIAAPSMAIATALSASPAEWMNAVLLSPHVVLTDNHDSLFRYLDRLNLENPKFVEGRHLGYVLLDLISRLSTLKTQSPFDAPRMSSYIDALLSRRFATDSLLKLLAAEYVIQESESTPEQEALANQRLWKGGRSVYGLRAPVSACVSRQWLSARPEWSNAIAKLPRVHKLST